MKRYSLIEVMAKPASFGGVAVVGVAVNCEAAGVSYPTDI